jgi:hypothetical protein
MKHYYKNKNCLKHLVWYMISYLEVYSSVDVHYMENSYSHVTNSLSKNFNNNPKLLTSFSCKIIRYGLFSLLCANTDFA